MTKYLAIDHGTKRLGIAISDDSKKYAFYRDTLLVDNKLLQKISIIVAEENIEKIIIGYPTSLQSEKTLQTLEVEKFTDSLRSFLFNKGLKPELVFHDERLTSRLALSNILESGLNKKNRRDKSNIDSEAARIILSDYLDSENRKL